MTAANGRALVKYDPVKSSRRGNPWRPAHLATLWPTHWYSELQYSAARFNVRRHIGTSIRAANSRLVEDPRCARISLARQEDDVISPVQSAKNRSQLANFPGLER